LITKTFCQRKPEVGLGKMNDRNILSGIGELLDAKQKEWAKANLRKDTIFLLQLMLKNGK
jgi:hypothetical protein